ncbi:MAG: hypothetical protein WBI17_05240 [Clostridiaceae bacterium]
MKKTAIDILYGVLVYIGIVAIQILSALPFRDPFSGESPSLRITQNYEYLIAVIPILIWTVIVTWISKIQNRSDALRKAIIWTGMVVVLDFIFGILNNTLPLTFGVWTYYIALIAVFLGPLFYLRLTSPR